MNTTLCKHGNAISIKPSIDFRICARCEAEREAFSEEIGRLHERHAHRNKVKDSGALSMNLVADIRRLWADHEELLGIATRLHDDVQKLLLRTKDSPNGN